MVSPSRQCVCMSVFLFLDINLSKYQWIFINLSSALILWRSGFRLQVGKFCQFLTELSAHNTSIFFVSR